MDKISTFENNVISIFFVILANDKNLLTPVLKI